MNKQKNSKNPLKVVYKEVLLHLF